MYDSHTKHVCAPCEIITCAAVYIIYLCMCVFQIPVHDVEQNPFKFPFSLTLVVVRYGRWQLLYCATVALALL